MKKLYRVFLQVRSINEKQRRRELAKKIAQRKEKEKEIEGIEKEKEKIVSQFGGEAQNSSLLPAWYMAHFLQYIERLREVKKLKEQELKKIFEEEEEERKRYMNAKRDYDVAQRFVMRKHDEERKSLMKKEEKFSDEVVLFGKVREKKWEKED